MSSATLIQCTNKKLDYETTAWRLYSKSDYFCKMRKWANLRDEPAYIISAKHGLVEFGDELEPYNKRGVSSDLAAQIASDLAAMGVDSVTVCLGYHDYLKPLEPALEENGVSIQDPFHKLGIGERLQLLQQKINELSNHEL